MTGSAWRTSSLSYGSGACAEVSAWRKPSLSFSNGNCAEVGTWRTSGYTYGGSNCAEVGAGDAVVGVRDTKEAHLGDARTVLEFNLGAWDRFLAQLRQEA